jgi:hypothetical protein
MRFTAEAFILTLTLPVFYDLIEETAGVHRSHRESSLCNRSLDASLSILLDPLPEAAQVREIPCDLHGTERETRLLIDESSEPGTSGILIGDQALILIPPAYDYVPVCRSEISLEAPDLGYAIVLESPELTTLIYYLSHHGSHRSRTRCAYRTRSGLRSGRLYHFDRDFWYHGSLISDDFTLDSHRATPLVRLNFTGSLYRFYDSGGVGGRGHEDTMSY